MELNKKNKIVLGLSILAVVVLVLASFSSAVDVTTDVDNELRDNSEIGTLDEDVYEEIITRIGGEGSIDWIKRMGLIRGEAKIYQGDYGHLKIWGYRCCNGGWEKFYYKGIFSVHAPRFIGFTTIGGFDPFVFGLAFDNIEWSKI